jgi:hypothetical protein
MFKRLNTLVIVALCTSCALIAFAFYQRDAASLAVPAVAFYFAAAFICLLPSLYAVFRHKTCRSERTPKIT